MKKLVLLMALMFVLPLTALATTYYFVVEDVQELSAGDNFMRIGKPAVSASFSSGTCDGGGSFPAGTWYGVTYLAGNGGGSPARIGTSYFVSNSLSNGGKLTLNGHGTTCTQAINGSTTTFDKFSGTN